MRPVGINAGVSWVSDRIDEPMVDVRVIEQYPSFLKKFLII